MDSASSSEEDEYEQPTQQKQKGAFKNDAEAFPDFGGGATQAPAASKMDFTKAWGSTKAPAAMPQPSSRPRKNKAPSAAPSSDAVQGGGEAAPVSTIPWRPSDWGAAMSNVPRWSGPAPRKFSNEPHQDPYTSVKAGSFQAPKERMLTKAQMYAAARAELESATPEPEKPKKEKKVVQKPKEDSDGFTSVAVKTRKNTGEKPKQVAAAIDTFNPMAALQMDEPAEKKEKAPKPAEAPKQESKGGKKNKKEKAAPKKEKAQQPKKGELKAAKQAAAKVEPPKAKDEQREQTTKKKSGGKKKKGGGGGGGGGQKAKNKDAGLPIAWVVAAAVVAAGVAYYFARTQI